MTPTEMTATKIAHANRRLVGRLALAVVAMFGFGFALAPLYDVLCQITGLNGKTNNGAVAAVAGGVDAERTVTVEFVAEVNESAPWQFGPQVVRMEVHPGEFYHTSYFAKNLTGEPLVGQAIPSVAPGAAARYFQKIECFCFARQAFGPGEGRDMPVTFRLDPAISPDISTVTLSYTFFKLDNQGS
jgi:cytochrome c oxidase assembly protein subunit 11